MDTLEPSRLRVRPWNIETMTFFDHPVRGCETVGHHDGHESLMLKDTGKKQIKYLAISPDGHRLCAVFGLGFW
jgi:hypothetical protein